MNSAERFIESRQRNMIEQRLRNHRVAAYLRRSVQQKMLTASAKLGITLSDLVEISLANLHQQDPTTQAALKEARERGLIAPPRKQLKQRAVRISPELGFCIERMADKSTRTENSMKSIFNRALVQALDAAEMELNRE